MPVVVAAVSQATIPQVWVVMVAVETVEVRFL
jgi:hypothetical protein